MAPRKNIPPAQGAHQSSDQNPSTVHRPGIIQRKATAPWIRETPSAPLAYRAHPVPRVLQAKVPASQKVAAQSSRQPVGPPVYRPQPLPRVLQRKMAVGCTQQPAHRFLKAATPQRNSAATAPVESASPVQPRMTLNIIQRSEPSSSTQPTGAARPIQGQPKDRTENDVFGFYEDLYGKLWKCSTRQKPTHDVVAKGYKLVKGIDQDGFGTELPFPQQIDFSELGSCQLVTGQQLENLRKSDSATTAIIKKNYESLTSAYEKEFNRQCPKPTSPTCNTAKRILEQRMEPFKNIHPDIKKNE